LVFKAGPRGFSLKAIGGSSAKLLFDASPFLAKGISNIEIVQMKVVKFTAPALIAASLISCENPADKTADASTTEAVAVEAGSDGGVSYVIAPDSKIGFVGSKVTGSHEGGFKEFQGSFDVVGEEVAGGSFVIDMNSTWSDAEKLTEHLKADDFFNVAEFPQAKFTVTKVEKTGSGYSISGNFELRGVEKNITFPATASKDGDEIKVKAEFDIKRKDWGISYEGKKDDMIRDEVVIKFDLVAAPEA
jgi:polyisoprenoid-binding protein YceI